MTIAIIAAGSGPAFAAERGVSARALRLAEPNVDRQAAPARFAGRAELLYELFSSKEDHSCTFTFKFSTFAPTAF